MMMTCDGRDLSFIELVMDERFVKSGGEYYCQPRPSHPGAAAARPPSPDVPQSPVTAGRTGSAPPPPHVHLPPPPDIEYEVDNYISAPLDRVKRSIGGCVFCDVSLCKVGECWDQFHFI